MIRKYVFALAIISLSAQYGVASPATSQEAAEIISRHSFPDKRVDRENGFVFVPYVGSTQDGSVWFTKVQLSLGPPQRDSHSPGLLRINFALEPVARKNGSWNAFQREYNLGHISSSYHYMFADVPCELSEEAKTLLSSDAGERYYVNPRHSEDQLCSGFIKIKESKLEAVKAYAASHKLMRPLLTTIDCSEDSPDVNLNDFLEVLVEDGTLSVQEAEKTYSGSHLKFLYESVQLSKKQPRLLGFETPSFEAWKLLMSHLRLDILPEGRVRIPFPTRNVFSCQRDDKPVEIVSYAIGD